MSDPKNRAQIIQDTLEALVSGTPDVTGAALVTEDGLIIGSVLPADAEEDSVGGMASVLLSLGGRVASELDLSDLEQVMIRGAKGNALMVSAGDGGLLLTLMTHRAKLGLVFLDVRRAAVTLGGLI